MNSAHNEWPAHAWRVISAWKARCAYRQRSASEWQRSRDAGYKIATYGLLLVISQGDNEEKCRNVVEVEGVEQRVSPSRSLLPRVLPNLHPHTLTTFVLAHAHVLGRQRAVFRRCRTRRRPVRRRARTRGTSRTSSWPRRKKSWLTDWLTLFAQSDITY